MMGLKLKQVSETSRRACGIVKGSPGYFSMKSIMFDVASWIIEIQELQFPKKINPFPPRFNLQRFHCDISETNMEVMLMPSWMADFKWCVVGNPGMIAGL